MLQISFYNGNNTNFVIILRNSIARAIGIQLNMYYTEQYTRCSEAFRMLCLMIARCNGIEKFVVNYKNENNFCLSVWNLHICSCLVF